MFGTNTIQGKAAFADLPRNVLKRTVTFPTLQGEGPLSGRRSLFLRLSHCQLACSFCDTSFDTGESVEFVALQGELSNKVAAFYDRYNLTYDVLEPFKGWVLVVTGGEPLLQNNLFRFIAYVDDPLFSPFDVVQIESNGIIAWPADADPDRRIMLVVSPKCVENNNVPLHHIRPHPLTLARANCLKFVISADQNNPYSKIPDWAFEWREQTGRPIYLSPMNVYLREPQASLLAAKSGRDLTEADREVLERISFWEEGLLDMVANRANHEYAALLCMKYNCILSLQTHLLASLP